MWNCAIHKNIFNYLTSPQIYLKMEKIINNTGFQHLVEKVFLNLKHQELEICAVINQSSKQILDNPMFWLKKYVSKGMSKKNETDWTKAGRDSNSYSSNERAMGIQKW